MSKIIGIELENFMSIKKEKFLFDDRNILNLKGYNDSGKSAVYRALDVLMTNAHPTDQKNFIHHGEDYFRVVVHFDDGVSILRDKYLTGSSLYEMYKDGELIFTTKAGNTLTRIIGVPLEVKEYLGLTETKQGSYLNFRSIYDSLFLVDTSGSENVELLNGVLQIKETSLALTAIKKDMTDTQSNINTIMSEIEATKISLERYSGLDEGFVELLKSLDSQSQELQEQFDTLSSLYSIYKEYQGISANIPNLSLIDDSYLIDLESLVNLYKSYSSISVLPTMDLIDSDLYTELLKLWELQNSADFSKVIDYRLESIDSSLYEDLENLYKHFENYCVLTDIDSRLTGELSQLSKEIDILKAEALERGISITPCSNCGHLVEGVGGHVHV